MVEISTLLKELPFNCLSTSELLDIFASECRKIEDIMVDTKLLDYITKFSKTEEFKELGFDYFTEMQFYNKLKNSSIRNMELGIFM